MKRSIFLVLSVLVVCGSPRAQADPLFAYTHVQPSPFTLRGGRLTYGTEVAYGITDFLQVGTNVVRDVFKMFNANAKISLLDLPELAVSPYVDFETYNLRSISDTNPDLHVTSWLPGLVTAVGLIPSTLALFVGGNLNLTSTKLVTNGIETSGYLRGASIGSDLSWMYNPPRPSRKGGRPHGGNALSAGVTYDITYKIFGVGISHHWPGFQLGVHYYPGATKYPLQPIVASGGVIDL